MARRFREGKWVWVEREGKGPKGVPCGAYVFFSHDRSLLERIVELEIEDGGPDVLGARISERPAKPRGEHVLELFARGESMEASMAGRYAHCSGLRFSGWRGTGVTTKAFFRKMCLYKRDLMA